MKKVRKTIVVTEEISEKEFSDLICEARISPNKEKIDAYACTSEQGYIRKIFSLPIPS